MSPLYHAILVTTWTAAGVILGLCLILLIIALRTPGKAGQRKPIAMLCGGFILLATLVLAPLHELLPRIGTLLPP